MSHIHLTPDGQLLTLPALDNAFSVLKDPTGFPNRTDSAFTFTDATLKLSVTVVSGSYDIWFSGVKHTISTTKEITITDTEGIHAIYFDTDDTLKEIINPTVANMLTLIRDKVLVSILYWDATNKASVLINEERHGTIMDGITHYYLHYTRGLQYISGLALNNFTIGDGSLNTHAQFGVASGSIADEDIGLTTTAVTYTAGLPILYKDGASAYWRRTTQAGYSVKASGSATNRIYYNQLTGGAWQLTEVGEGNYVLCHVYTYNGKNEQVFSIMGQNEYATLPAARAGATTEISAIALGSLPSPEFRPVATVIFQTDKDYANAIKARVIEVSTGENYINWLTTELPRGVTPPDHQSLSNLLLARSGVTYGHIDDGAQTIAGIKTFSSTIAGSINGNAATVTTNANLTGPITSVGNATAIASQTGTGTTFVVSQGPTIDSGTFTTYLKAIGYLTVEGTTGKETMRSSWSGGPSNPVGAFSLYSWATGSQVEKARLSADTDSFFNGLTVYGTLTGTLTGNADTVTGFTRTAGKTLTLTDNATVNQSVDTSASPTFAGITYAKATCSTITTVNTTTPAVDFSTSDMFSLAMPDADRTMTFSNPRVGNFILRVQHNAVQHVLTFPTVYFSGVTGTSAKAYTLTAGNTKYTIFNIFCDGSSYWCSDVPYTA